MAVNCLLQTFFFFFLNLISFISLFPCSVTALLPYTVWLKRNTKIKNENHVSKEEIVSEREIKQKERERERSSLGFSVWFSAFEFLLSFFVFCFHVLVFSLCFCSFYLSFFFMLCWCCFQMGFLVGLYEGIFLGIWWSFQCWVYSDYFCLAENC